MALPSKPLPTLGRPNATEDIKILDVARELQTTLAGGVDASNLAPPPAAVSVALLRTTWTNPLSVFRDPTGVVYVGGGLNINQATLAASTVDPIATFPQGYRPGQRIVFGLHLHGEGTHDSRTCRLEPDGNLYMIDTAGLTSQTWDFSSIPTFRAES